MAYARRARSLAAEEGTPTRRPAAMVAADSPVVRFMAFQPLPSPANHAQ